MLTVNKVKYFHLIAIVLIFYLLYYNFFKSLDVQINQQKQEVDLIPKPYLPFQINATVCPPVLFPPTRSTKRGSSLGTNSLWRKP